MVPHCAKKNCLILDKVVAITGLPAKLGHRRKIKPKTRVRTPNQDCIRAKAPFEAEYASVWRTEAIGRKEPSMIVDAEKQCSLSRDRSCREQLAGALGRPENG
jgi:hypothetical protein